MSERNLAGKSTDHIPSLAQGGKEHEHDQNVVKVDIARCKRKKKQHEQSDENPWFF
jgi:hypothetical protein